MAPLLLLTALLCGCGTDENSGEDVRAHYENISGFSAHVKILSETDDFTMAFELDYAYNKEDVDVFTITAPESVSGVSGRIAGDSEATLALQYDDLVLDDARPVRPAWTPADAVFGVVCALRDTPADESWRESADGHGAHRAALPKRERRRNHRKTGLAARGQHAAGLCRAFRGRNARAEHPVYIVSGKRRITPKIRG